MRIGIISDTHDNIWKLNEVLFTLEKTEVVIHCGDLCSPFIIKHLSDRLNDVPIHIVWGNNDGDKFLIGELARKAGNIQIHGEFADIRISNYRIAITHYPDIANAIASSNTYDLVCYGHDHIAHEEMVDETLLLNPGEVMGMNGKSSAAIVTLPEKSVEWVYLE